MPRTPQPREFVVIGLGRFGFSVARRLEELGSSVLSIDRSRAVVQAAADDLTDVIALDATDRDALLAAGIEAFDTAIVDLGDDLARTILVAVTLKDLGIRRIVAHAVDESAKRVLARVGVDEVVLPAYDFGRRVAERLVAGEFVARYEAQPGAAVVVVAVPEALAGKTLAEILPHDNSFTALLVAGRALVPAPPGDVVVAAGDRVWVLCPDGKVQALRATFG
jgi:trk system potassium uptake protein TrkA